MNKRTIIFIFMTYILFTTAFSYTIDNIIVQGNRHVMDTVIKLSLSVSEGDEIDNETGKITRLEEKIRNEVLDLGYFGNTTVKIVPISREKANIQISVLEFPVIKEIVFEGEDIIPRQEIIDTMQTKKGEQLNVNTFKEDLVRLRELFYEKGVMLGQNSNITLSKEFDKVIVKTHKAIVNSIDIVGNTKSKDYVIRREIELETGDVYDFVDLRRSYQNLVNTGYFKKIDFLPEVDSAGNVDLDVKVEEEETGSFRFGGTYGSENGLSGLIEVKDKNFKGRGYSLQLKAEFGGVDSYEFSYFNPRWHNKKRSLGVNIYDTKYDRDKYDLFGNYLYSYDEKRKGFSLSWGTNITRFTKFGIACYDEKISIEPVSLNIPDDHSQTISVSVAKDIRDNVFYPKYGYYAKSSVDFTGGFIKGKDDFSRYIQEFRWFKELNKRFVFAFRGKYGKIEVREGILEDYEKFALGGGNSIRGYESREFLGYEMMLFNSEIRYEINDSLKFVVFYDEGQMDFNSTLTDTGKRSGSGVGIQFNTPMGVLRLDYGKAGDRSSKSYFNFGQMF